MSSLALLRRVRSMQRFAEQSRTLRLRVKERRRTQNSPPESILDFFVRVSPHLYRPEHFACYTAQIESAIGGGHRLVFSAPPQHGKTSVTLHGLAWLILRYPGRRHAYVTYSQTRARSVARTVRRILAAAGVVTGGTLDTVTTGGGGQCLFNSIDGGITGEPVDGCAIIDDPIKNRREADSPTRRRVVEESYREVIEPRVHPGASIFLLATRWHPEDLSGTLIGDGWDSINLPAVAEAGDSNDRAVGEPLFPDLWPLDALDAKRAKVLDFTWAALYQGRPRPKGGTVFRSPTYYSRLPDSYRGAYGVDLAFTARATADWSVCLELWREERGNDAEPLFYVVHVDRAQVEAPDFALTLRARHVRRPAWPILWRCSGAEKGSADFLRRREIPITTWQPPGDKLVSATDVAAAWNNSRVLVPDPEVFPEEEAWLLPFLDVVANFSGTGVENDDDVDALGNAYALLDDRIDTELLTKRSTRR